MARYFFHYAIHNRLCLITEYKKVCPFGALRLKLAHEHDPDYVLCIQDIGFDIII